MSLRYKIIFLFFLAIVIPALFLSLIITSISRKYIRTSIFFQQQEIVRRVADRINSQIDRHQQLLSINGDIALQSKRNQLQAAKEILVQGNAFEEIALLDSKGQEQWKYTHSGPVKTLVNRLNRNEYQEVQSGKDYISQVQLTAQRNPFIILSVPLKNKTGVLIAKLYLHQVWKWISEIQIGKTGQAFVVDNKGILVAHREPERVWAHSNFGNLPIVKDFLNNKEPSPERWSEYKDERGEKVIALYQSLPKLNWAVVTQIPYTEVYSPIRKMKNNIILWTIFWTGVFLFIGFRFVQRITNPLSVLQAGVHEISKGKLDIKLDIHTGDEIEELAKNFEKMAGTLKSLEAFRQDLVRMIIHDLKSPLSGIMGSLDYLESGFLGGFTPEQGKIISLAKKSSESLLSMIQNLLDVAKMEEGKLELNKEKVDIAKLFDERKHQFDPLVANEGKSISIKLEEGTPSLFIDFQLIERVLNNLLTNAFTHTSKGGHIVLEAKKKGNFIELSVSDDGEGIPKEYIDKIFEKFIQVNRKQVRVRTGAGLGLTFCKMVAETHGGNIRVESELNKGSSFIMSLPLS